MKIWALVFVALAFSDVRARASPPPPPPEFVQDAAELLVSRTFDLTLIEGLLADDVDLRDNGKIIANNKSEAVSWFRAGEQYSGRNILGHSESGGIGEGAIKGAILVLETYDTVSRVGLPAGSLADPRMASRSILYQFGVDHLIHHIEVQTVAGFWQGAKR